MPRFGPIEFEPRRLRPPYDTRDHVDEIPVGHDRDEFQRYLRRLHERRLAVLLEPLDGIKVSNYERYTLQWLCEWEVSTVAVVAALLHRARAAAPLSAGGHEAGERS